MEIIVDDREKQVIPVLKALRDIQVKRITVGDYVFTHGGKIICIVERKTLADLSSSIKDGRMNNHNKLLNAQKICGCTILYIIEGPAYPSLNRNFARMNFKCLQGKLDSIMFRNDIKIIWTRDIIHTAERLVGLCHTFYRLIDQGAFAHLFELKNTEKNVIEQDKNKEIVEFNSTNVETAGGNTTAEPETKTLTESMIEPKVNEIINAVQEVKLDMIHINMLRAVPNVSYKAAAAMLQMFNIRQLLLCVDVKVEDWYNTKSPDTMYKLGNRGIKMFNSCRRLLDSPVIQASILAQVQGITKQTASLILNNVNAESIIKCEFEAGAIANIKKENGRRIGKAVETRIKLTFTT